MDELNLSEFFTTKNQASEFMVKLDQIIATIFETKFDLEVALGKYFSFSQKDKFLKFLRISKVNTKNPTELKQFFEKIKESVSQMKVINLKLAFEPSDKNLISFSNWFRMNVKKQFLFEITVDPKIVAGVEINFNGKYLDFSIRRSLEQIFNPQPAAPAQPTNGFHNSPTPQVQLDNRQFLARPS